MKEQIELISAIQDIAGINLVTCGNCGAVQLMYIDKETITCYQCKEDMDQSDCPDLFYVGMPGEND